MWMRSSRDCGRDLAESGWDLAERLERLAVNAKVATVLDSIPVSSDTVESAYIKKEKSQNPPFIFAVYVPPPLLHPSQSVKRKRDDTTEKIRKRRAV
jgi:hypothetical protein